MLTYTSCKKEKAEIVTNSDVLGRSISSAKDSFEKSSKIIDPNYTGKSFLSKDLLEKRTLDWDNAFSQSNGDTIAVFVPVILPAKITLVDGGLKGTNLNDLIFLRLMTTGNKFDGGKSEMIVLLPNKVQKEEEHFSGIMLGENWFKPNVYTISSANENNREKGGNVVNGFKPCETAIINVCIGAGGYTTCEPSIVRSCSGGGDNGGGGGGVGNPGGGGKTTGAGGNSGGGGNTPTSAPATQMDLSNVNAFGGPVGASDDGRLSCSSFKFTASGNSQEAGIKSLSFVVQLPNGGPVRVFNFRTMFISIGVVQADGSKRDTGAAAEAAAHAANLAAASLTVKYGGIKTIEQINSLLSSNVEKDFKELYEICLQNEVRGYGAVSYTATLPNTIVSTPVWNGNATQVFNWLTQKGCDN